MCRIPLAVLFERLQTTVFYLLLLAIYLECLLPFDPYLAGYLAWLAPCHIALHLFLLIIFLYTLGSRYSRFCGPFRCPTMETRLIISQIQSTFVIHLNAKTSLIYPSQVWQTFITLSHRFLNDAAQV